MSGERRPREVGTGHGPDARCREEELARAARDYWLNRAPTFAGFYGRSRGPAGWLVGRFLDRRIGILDPWLKAGPGTRALDAGCGRGADLALLARQGARVTGIDVSADMIALAREALDEAGASGYSLVHGSVSEADLPEEDFDVVIAIGLLDYLPDWRAVLGRLARWSRPGGTVIFTVPLRPSPFFFLRSGPGLWLRTQVFDLPPVLVSLTRREVEEAAESSGLLVKELRDCSRAMWAVRCERG